jgi:hypothetical protein
MIKKKCNECGTLYPTNRTGECAVCAEDDWSTACEKHPTLNLGGASSCQMCESERGIGEYRRKERGRERERRESEDKISLKDGELGRLSHGNISSLEIQRARLLGIIQGPSAQLARVINTPATMLARVLQAKMKGNQGLHAMPAQNSYHPSLPLPTNRQSQSRT